MKSMIDSEYLLFPQAVRLMRRITHALEKVNRFLKNEESKQIIEDLRVLELNLYKIK